MADFAMAFALTSNNEKGFANNPVDSGGMTYRGISRNNWPQWEGWEKIDHIYNLIREENLTAGETVTKLEMTLQNDRDLQNLVEVFYRQNFWSPLNLDQIQDQALANIIFDFAVNGSKRRLGKFLQIALNSFNNGGVLYPDLRVDGFIGPRTLDMVKKHNHIFRDCKILRLAIIVQVGFKYLAIAGEDERQEAFTRGWFMRLARALDL